MHDHNLAQCTLKCEIKFIKSNTSRTSPSSSYHDVAHFDAGKRPNLGVIDSALSIEKLFILKSLSYYISEKAILEIIAAMTFT